MIGVTGMTGIGYIFALEDGDILSADDYGFGAVRWFMNDRELNNPECSVYYKDATVQTFTSDFFYPGPSYKIHQENAVAFLLVAGLDEDDEDRVTLLYTVGSNTLVLNFPMFRKLNAKGKRLLKRFEKAMELSGEQICWS